MKKSIVYISCIESLQQEAPAVAVQKRMDDCRQKNKGVPKPYVLVGYKDGKRSAYTVIAGKMLRHESVLLALEAAYSAYWVLEIDFDIESLAFYQMLEKFFYNFDKQSKDLLPASAALISRFERDYGYLVDVPGRSGLMEPREVFLLEATVSKVVEELVEEVVATAGDGGDPGTSTKVDLAADQDSDAESEVSVELGSVSEQSNDFVTLKQSIATDKGTMISNESGSDSDDESDHGYGPLKIDDVANEVEVAMWKWRMWKWRRCMWKWRRRMWRSLTCRLCRWKFREILCSRNPGPHPQKPHP